MNRNGNVWLGWLLLVTVSLAGCGHGNNDSPATTVSSSFESGSIGKVSKIADTEWELSLVDDNNDPTLPATWRSWWYVKMDNAAQYAPTRITLKNSGWPYYYLPVYSYDQKEWLRFAEGEVTQNTNNELIVNKKFDHTTVWLARFYPYTFTDLQHYLKTIQGNPYVEIRIPGYSKQGRPLYVLKITDPLFPVSGKKRILMHARTHPAETSPSFLIEGLIARLLSGTGEASELLSGFEFYIFPMQNVDGVIAGNYRSTPKTENLEMSWVFDSKNPRDLTGDVPPEVAFIHRYATDLMSDGGPLVSMALNLHASNSEPDIRPFFYPHFGPVSRGYLPVEASLWDKQLLFIGKVAMHHGLDMIEPVPDDGGGSFATKTYPESWWWANYQDRVLAMTLEMTYGRAGYTTRWIVPGDMRDLGTSLVLGIRDYYTGSGAPAKYVSKPAGVFGTRNLKYPQLYPPKAADELKE
jgi:hypothetical protein